jgi:tRNA threonylcarbamoyladenosine biosynthesis protein TsaE
MRLIKEIDYQLDAVNEVAQEIATLLFSAEVVLFEGEMGAGKTTFIKGLVAIAGSKDAVTSPTYSLVNKYLIDVQTSTKKHIYHLDLFRLKSTAEVIDIGMEEILDSGEIIFIEWADLIEDICSQLNMIKLNFKKVDQYSRKLNIFKNY